MKEFVAILIVIMLVCCLAFFESATQTTVQVAPQKKELPAPKPSFKQRPASDWQSVGF